MYVTGVTTRVRLRTNRVTHVRVATCTRSAQQQLQDTNVLTSFVVSRSLLYSRSTP